MLKVVQVVLFASFANAASPCDSLLAGSRGTTPLNVDTPVHENFFVSICEEYQSALMRHPDVNITTTSYTALVGGNDPLGLPSGAYKLWLYAQMLHYKETDIELMWLDAPWIQSIKDYLEPIPLLPAEKAAFFPKTVHENDAGDLVTVPIKSNYRINFYNHDLFVKYNVQWPKTWDELEAVCQKVAQGERALGRYFWCLDWDIETQDTNRFSSYISMMASVDGGGDLILPGGIVNVNTPQLRKALVTMKRWINLDFMFGSPTARTAATEPVAFDKGNFLIQQTWTENIIAYEGFQQGLNFKVKVGGSLGGEYGVDGSWHLAINKAMRHKDLGVNLVKELIPHLYNVTMHIPNFVPAWSGVLDDPVRKAAWCAKVPMYCESYETYTDYHTKLSYRPSKGCGALYSECVQLIAQHLMSGYVHGATDLETAVTDLQTGLAKLLGAVNLHEATAASEKAEGSRIALIVVASVSAVLLVLIAVYVRTAMLKLRKVGFKIPVAAMLGFVTAASLVVVTVVVLTQMDASARSISEDLALRLRVASLHSVQSTLHSDDLNNPLLSETQKRRTALSLMMHWVSQLEVEPGSLIFTLTYDQVAAEVQVLMSTDNSVQKEHVFLPVHAPPNGAEVSEVLHAFLQEFGWKLTQGQLFDPKQQHTLSADEEYYVNVKSVDTMPWHIVYIVPVSAVMGEATDSRNAARNYGILASLIAILVVTAFATFITRPLIGVSHHMEMARVMQFDEHYVPGSYLAETRALQEGFRSMAELLVQYKTFLPQSIFQTSDDSDEVLMESTGTSGLEGITTASYVSKTHVSSNSRSACEARQAMISAHTDLSSMKESKGCLLICSIQNLGALSQGGEYTELFHKLEKLAHEHSGVLHIFNSMSPGKIAVSFGLTRSRAPSTCVDKAAFMAFEILRIPLVQNRTILLSVTLHQGKMRTGNLGSERTRGFGIMGRGAGHALLVDEYAGDLACVAQTSLILATSGVVQVMKNRVLMRSVNVLRGDSEGDNVHVTQLREVLAVADDEWMYQLEEVERNQAKDSDKLQGWIDALRNNGEAECAKVREEVAAATFEGDPVAEAVAEQLSTIEANDDITAYSVRRAYTNKNRV